VKIPKAKKTYAKKVQSRSSEEKMSFNKNDIDALDCVRKPFERNLPSRSSPETEEIL